MGTGTTGVEHVFCEDPYMKFSNARVLWLKVTETVDAGITGKVTSVSMALLIGI